MPGSRVSILMPLFNEEEYVGTILERVIQAPLPAGLEREIIVVDDGSTDDSAEIAAEMSARYPGLIQLFRFEQNRGKGAAIREAVEHASGDYCLIQDSDLEYNPADYLDLLQPLVDGVADVVYGSRFAIAKRRRVLYLWHSVANHILTAMCNVVSDLNLSDIMTGYKAFRTPLLKSIPIRSNRFGVEPELTIKIARRYAETHEVPVSYDGRTYEDGKKIRFKDAVQIAWAILRFGLVSDLYKDPGAEILDAFSATSHFNLWMADTIRPFVGKRVLEIGAGMGNLTRHLSRRRERYVATDIDAEHLARLRNRLRHRPKLESAVLDLSQAADFQPFSNSMDTVICLNVLEHLEDDLACLRNIHSALQPGGRAIILVPEGQSLFGQIDVVLGHYRRYSREQLRARLQEAGFSVEQILNFNRISRPAWFLNSRILQRSRLGRFQLKLFDKMVWFWRRADRFIPWGPTSIIAIARTVPVAIPFTAPVTIPFTAPVTEPRP
jgi:glycosyltransferase involved in cell wall biosynthesis